MLAVATPVARGMANHHRRLFTLPSEVRSGLYLTGGLGVEPPAKISDPPAAIKKGDRLSLYLCISTVVDFNSQTSTPPP